MRRRIRSLQVGLALRVAALYILATIAAIAVLMTRAYDTARSLSDQELLLRARDLAGHVSVGTNGLPRLEQFTKRDPAATFLLFVMPMGA